MRVQSLGKIDQSASEGFYEQVSAIPIRTSSNLSMQHVSSMMRNLVKGLTARSSVVLAVSAGTLSALRGFNACSCLGELIQKRRGTRHLSRLPFLADSMFLLQIGISKLQRWRSLRSCVHRHAPNWDLPSIQPQRTSQWQRQTDAVLVS